MSFMIVAFVVVGGRRLSVIPGWCDSTRPGISRFRVRVFDAPRNDFVTSSRSHFFTSGQRDSSSDWNASLPGMVANSL
jgi:hypothetical protein